MNLALPSQVVALLTFPGVVVRGVVEQLVCRWSEVAVLKVCCLGFGRPAGCVTHEPGLNVRRLLLIGIIPFLVNSLLGALVAFPAILPALEFRVSTAQSYVLAWLGISIATHATPDADSAVNLWQAVRSPECSRYTRLWATPVVGLMRVVSAGRVFAFDLVYGVLIATAPPVLLMYFLR